MPVDGPLGARELLTARAREASTGPGVYFLLGADRALLYVGKATSLRRRLSDHARAALDPTDVRSRLWAEVRDLVWKPCSSEHEALCREADVIVALAPPRNKVMVRDAYVFVEMDVVHHGAGERITLRLEDAPHGVTDKVYGGFPHLGKGKASWRAVRTNAGYSALLRVLWVAFGDAYSRVHIPARLRGSSPPLSHTAGVDASDARMLHDFLSGRSVRLLDAAADALSTSDVHELVRRPLEADLASARQFYELGPRALRALRARHGLPAGPVDRATFVRVITDEVRDEIGDFTVRPRTTDAKLVGRRMATMLDASMPMLP
jgi:predicted GIY-YIG superfamily endonuclease